MTPSERCGGSSEDKKECLLISKVKSSSRKLYYMQVMDYVLLGIKSVCFFYYMILDNKMYVFVMYTTRSINDVGT